MRTPKIINPTELDFCYDKLDSFSHKVKTIFELESYCFSNLMDNYNWADLYYYLDFLEVRQDPSGCTVEVGSWNISNNIIWPYGKFVGDCIVDVLPRAILKSIQNYYEIRVLSKLSDMNSMQFLIDKKTQAGMNPNDLYKTI